MRRVLSFLGLTLIGHLNLSAQQLSEHSIDTILMGSSFSFTAVAETNEQVQASLRAGIDEVIRIEKLISSWSDRSETSEINRNAGKSEVTVSRELMKLIQRSKKISQMSNGYFDISFASVDRIWKFDGKVPDPLPSDEEIRSSVAKIDYQAIVVNEEANTVFLKNKGMKIGFGAIGKGYAADMAKQKMLETGAQSGVVNAGGDLLAWGQRPDGLPWSVGIADPTDKTNVISWINVSDMAVVTSGNYEKYFLYKGKKYCHIINPRTGWPVTGTKSVTIISPSAEFSDALATTAFILGKEEGMELINHLDGVEGIIIDDRNETYYSKNVETNFIKNR